MIVALVFESHAYLRVIFYASYNCIQELFVMGQAISIEINANVFAIVRVKLGYIEIYAGFTRCHTDIISLFYALLSNTI